jgi:hypothetical protein
MNFKNLIENIIYIIIIGGLLMLNTYLVIGNLESTLIGYQQAKNRSFK